MRATQALIAAAVAALLWLAGEQHRENCIAESRAGCSVLPWDRGEQTRTGIDLTEPKSATDRFYEKYGGR